MAPQKCHLLGTCGKSDWPRGSYIERPVVVWKSDGKYADTIFWGPHSGEKLLEKLAPFEEFRSRKEEEAKPGGGNMKKSQKYSLTNYIA